MAFATKMFSSHEETYGKNLGPINHFSHRHPLVPATLYKDDMAVCSGCELNILGGSSTYVCTKPGCAFLLHNVCLDLPRRIRHRAHPKHPLALLCAPPYGDQEFTCDACGNSGHAFTYHCGACMFDLHIECASLPEMQERVDHEHPLILVWGISGEIDGRDSLCFVCGEGVGKGRWVYACLGCNYFSHLECIGN